MGLVFSRSLSTQVTHSSTLPTLHACASDDLGHQEVFFDTPSRVLYNVERAIDNDSEIREFPRTEPLTWFLKEE
jgi:hypothetical protein